MMTSSKQICTEMNSTKYSQTQKFAIVSILIMIMEADGVIDPNEINFLNGVLSSFNISESELEIINSYDFNQCQKILSNMTAHELANAKSIFIEMAECDGYAHPQELEIINRLGAETYKRT